MIECSGLPFSFEDLRDVAERDHQTIDDRRHKNREALNRLVVCVTMSHMKEISIRELHRRTGAWVRNARKYGVILVRDRNIPVAKLVPITGEALENLF